VLPLLLSLLSLLLSVLLPSLLPSLLASLLSVLPLLPLLLSALSVLLPLLLLSLGLLSAMGGALICCGPRLPVSSVPFATTGAPCLCRTMPLLLLLLSAAVAAVTEYAFVATSPDGTALNAMSCSSLQHHQKKDTQQRQTVCQYTVPNCSL
jgi:hypothetical protein